MISKTETGPCFKQQQQSYVAATCRYVANQFSDLKPSRVTLPNVFSETVAMAHGVVPIHSHSAFDDSDRWVVYRVIDRIGSQGCGNGVLKQQIVFCLGVLMGWCARDRLGEWGDASFTWQTSPESHGKSLWNASHFSRILSPTVPSPISPFSGIR